MDEEIRLLLSIEEAIEDLIRLKKKLYLEDELEAEKALILF